ncbi:MAG: OmpA family protein [Filimonas sp.]|nr:OmpA family protein [Filimonas sp.]
MQPFLRYSFLLLCLTVVLFTAKTGHAQEQKPMSRVAAEHLVREEYAAAIPLYEDMTKKKPDINLLRKLAYCYAAINAYDDAVRTGKRITVLPQANATDWLALGDALKSCAKYEDAKAAYVHAGADTSVKVQQRIAGCDSAMVWKKATAGYRVSNYEYINTPLSDWGAVPYPGNDVVFTSAYSRFEVLDPKAKWVLYNDARTAEPFLNIYVLDSTHFDLIRGLAPPFNRYQFHTGPVAFSSDYNTAYFTVTNVNKINRPKQKALPAIKAGDRRLELFISKRNNGAWQKSIPFAYNKAEAYSVGHAALSKDGKVLYFTSDMPGGYGATDIWYCELQADSSWSVPRNCGPVINTSEQDDFPTINDDDGLYFSSKGHVGMGGLDIFYARGAKDTWQPPQNMKSPVNSEGDDFYFTRRDAITGLLSSNRSGGKGSDDIYLVTAENIPPEKKIMIRTWVLQTTVLDEQRNVLPGATVRVDDSLTNRTWTQQTNASGRTYQLIDPAIMYKVSAYKQEYNSRHTYANAQRDNTADTVHVELILAQETQWHKGDTFELKDIYYNFDKWAIRADAQPALDNVAKIMQAHPGIRIELASHTDCRGSDAYNMTLSQRRAESAAAYLVRKGIDASRIVSKGYGKRRLANGCDCAAGKTCSEAEHQQNRRTVITVLSE